MKEDGNILTVSDIAAIIGMVTGISGLIFSFWSHTRSRADIVSSFLAQIRDEKAIAARKHIYNTETIATDDEMASSIVNFYHHWGIMVKHHYLPLWAFEESNARGTIRLFHKLKPFIEEMRRTQNNYAYASGFQWLCKKLESRNSAANDTLL